MKLKFLGAAKTVTGSKYLVESGGKKILIDCGLYQGEKELRLRNWDALPVEPAHIDAVVLTHAHIDHSGYIPLLVKKGFRGKIHATSATVAQCGILLPDSGHLQEEEAKYASRKGYSKHKEPLPLYTEDDAIQSLRSFKTEPLETAFTVVPGVTATFMNSGHILGAAMIRLTDGRKSIVFTGDLGRPNDPLFKSPAIVKEADYLVVESTYGNRLHDDSPVEDVLAEIIASAWQKKSVVLVPAFSVGRSQLLLYYLSKLKEANKIPDIPVFLNSPMSINATGIFCDHLSDHRLSADACKNLCAVAKYVRSPEESRRLNERSGPMIIISANGMATGGRILHHLKAFAPDPANTILFTGYQASGTRGAKMAGGARSVKMFGEEVPIRAQVKMLDNLSAHADAAEIMAWLKNFKAAPRMTFVTHGEAAAAAAMGDKIKAELAWPVAVPDYLTEVELA